MIHALLIPVLGTLAISAIAIYRRRKALENAVLKPQAKALGYRAHVNKWTGDITVTPPKERES